MDKNKLMEQLRKAVREVIQEELRHGKSSYDAKSGISSTELKNQEGDVVGYIKHTKKDGKLVAGGRIGPKAAKAVTAEEKITTNIPVAALPSYKKGEQPTVINPQTGEEEIESDVSSWAKALERRFGHLKPGESASLKGDPKKVTSARKKSMEDKAREMGQMDMFTLEEWIGMMEEAGYSLTEKFNPDEPILAYHSTSMPTGACRQCGAMPGQPCNCENDDDSDDWSDDEVERSEPDPRNEGGALEERNMANKAAKDTVISQAGRSARIAAMAKHRRAGNPFAGIGIKNLDSPDHESHNKIYNKKVGRRDTKFSPTEERNKENKKRRTPLLQDPEEY